MKFFYAPGTIAVASALALEEAGLLYEPIKIDFSQSEQTGKAFQNINPKGRVPALATDGQILTETGAILEYLGQLAPEAGLIPQDPMDAFRMREVMYYLASTMHVAHAHKLRGHRWADRPESWADMTAKVPETMAACCTHLEDSCAFAPYVLGEQISLADLYLYAVCNWLEGDKVDIANYPKIQDFMHAMNTRPATIRIRAAGFL
ncbi:glutathione S-transferase [Aliiroseovarius halocynthiae]|uniref:Glutathione S-transferase family protein n=1 Tax=Aliiroseovarius halocynthiae TaxID=985055 RepID=A0A545SP93_9RHOB|nr:glutathione S-transferase family protein [Aliiroseovarius halocynthiae]TQV66767.1 glutathione S-transferase family protein [Aliiroseovarius halocynthiae]SMR82406.1 glutathione S-transferase [Aliiroseovarius halocynthiae]